jgi:RNA polymerase sigma-70 factor (ECF subfamily)
MAEAAEAELKGLMLAGLAGDAAAHRRLLSLLSARLRAYYKGRLGRIGRSATEAEDLVQEALIAIHTRRHTYDPGQPLLPWVHAIARYKLIDHLRATRAMRAHVPIEDAEELSAAGDQVAAESAYDLHRLLARLLDGLSVSETARQCGISESAVKVNVHRGLRRLAAAIAEEKRK